MRRLVESELSPEVLRINIIRMRRNEPYAILQEIGDRFGITRERVRQILREAGKRTAAILPPNPCPQCGREMGRNQHKFCGYECFHNYTHTLIPCSYCGGLGEYSIKWMTWEIDHNRHSTDLWFCTRICQGKWLGENHGFVKYPEHMGGGIQKWDYAKVYELRDRTGWSGLRVGRALGIPDGTIYGILSKRSTEA